MEYPMLWHLMGTYFHEDSGGLDEALDEYLGEATDDDLRTLVSDLDRFMAATEPGAYAAAVHRLGANVWLGDEPEPYVAWLRGIRDQAWSRLHPGT